MHLGLPVTAIGANAFYGCRSISGVTIPDTVTKIGGSAFAFCSSLRTVLLPPSVAEVGKWAFDGCTALERISVDAASRTFTSLGGHLYTKDLRTLVRYAPGNRAATFAVPEGTVEIAPYALDGARSFDVPTGVTEIAPSTFLNCIALSSVTLPEGLRTIGFSAFSGCASLRSITLPASVRSVDQNAFENCAVLSDFRCRMTKSAWFSVNTGIFWKKNASFTAVKCTDGDCPVFD